jgi:hypothetical protein
MASFAPKRAIPGVFDVTVMSATRMASEYAKKLLFASPRNGYGRFQEAKRGHRT